jgi:hypothetical protein
MRDPPLSGRVSKAYEGCSMPWPPLGTWIDSQVPPITNFQALGWKSTVEVPWHVVPGPAAQSFWPLSATP